MKKPNNENTISYNYHIYKDGVRQKLSREERREIERKKRKLEKKLRGVNLPVVFDNDTVTASGNFALIETFERMIGLKEIVEKEFTLKKAPNSKYSTTDLLLEMIDSCILGKSRFVHTEELRHDPGYKEIKGIKDFPGEKCFRELYGKFDDKGKHLEELEKINDRIISMKSQTETPREVWFDYDDTVIELFGEQELGERGYNPRYKGRPSLKAKVCFISGSAELLKIDLYGGKTHLNKGFLEFHKACEDKLPRNYVLKGIRGDAAVFDEENLEYFEEKSLEYVLKAKMNGSLKRKIMQIGDWKKLNDRYSIAEIEIALDSWKHARRFVVIRENMSIGGQLYLGKEFYKYQAIVTDIMDMSPEEIWHLYNGRGTVENKIDELKNGFAVSEASQHEIKRNRAYALVKQIAYNIFVWWKAAVLPDERKGCEIETVRHEIINVPGNIVGSGRYKRIRLAVNGVLEWIVQVIKRNLKKFFYTVASDFNLMVWDVRAGP
jgi:hypothetical protein